MKSLVYGLVALVPLSFSVQAAFINGLETFDGTIKDTVTWQEHISGAGASISQNNALTLNGWCEYQSRQALVSKGDTVIVRITGVTTSPTHPERFSGFLLTDFSSGSWTDYGFKAGIEHYCPAEGNNSFFAGYTADSTGLLSWNMLLGGFSPTEHALPFHLRVTLGLDNVLRYAAYDSNQEQICTFEQTASYIPEQMYLRLYGNYYGGGSTFDNIQIIPEPCALALLALGGLLLRRR